MSQHTLALLLGSLIATLVACPGCGDRRVPAQDASPRAGDTVPPPGCVEPPGGCRSNDDCADGEVCDGCRRDPCCPSCEACYGSCIKPTCPTVRCKVVNSCCWCGAVDAKIDRPCSASCGSTVCDEWPLVAPVAYCVAEQCLVGDAGSACHGDSDCELTNDCCNCDALPKPPRRGVGDEIRTHCLAVNCFIKACDRLELVSPQARCLGGMCRVVTPTP